MTDLLRPLAPGTPLGYWQVSEITATRYDVPDAPMQGEMDPFFFLTKRQELHPARISLPHPLRRRTPRQTAGRARRSRASPATGCPSARRARPLRLLVPPHPDRRLGRTMIHWPRPPARPGSGCHLRRRGAFRQRPRGRLDLAPYTRNKEASAEIEVALAAGDNDAPVFFDDLAERDARFCFQLDWLDGPPARQASPFAAAPDAVAAIEAALGAMHFEPPAYAGGDVAPDLPRPARPARPRRDHGRGRIHVHGSAFA